MNYLGSLEKLITLQHRSKLILLCKTRLGLSIQTQNFSSHWLSQQSFFRPSIALTDLQSSNQGAHFLDFHTFSCMHQVISSKYFGPWVVWKVLCFDCQKIPTWFLSFWFSIKSSSIFDSCLFNFWIRDALLFESQTAPTIW